MAKKYNVDDLPDIFTVSDFVEKYGVQSSRANKTIKYWLSKNYIKELGENKFTKVNQQKSENVEHKTEEIVKKSKSQEVKSDVVEKSNDINKLYSVLVADVTLTISGKSIEDVVSIVKERYNYPDKAIQKIQELKINA